jgi:hypothetical protein
MQKTWRAEACERTRVKRLGARHNARNGAASRDLQRAGHSAHTHEAWHGHKTRRARGLHDRAHTRIGRGPGTKKRRTHSSETTKLANISDQVAHSLSVSVVYNIWLWWMTKGLGERTRATWLGTRHNVRNGAEDAASRSLRGRAHTRTGVARAEDAASEEACNAQKTQWTRRRRGEQRGTRYATERRRGDPSTRLGGTPRRTGDARAEDAAQQRLENERERRSLENPRLRARCGKCRRLAEYRAQERDTRGRGLEGAPHTSV